MADRLAIDTGAFNGRCETGLHGENRLAVPLDKELRHLAVFVWPGPATEEPEQMGCDLHRRLPFVGRLAAFLKSVEDALLEIDPGSALGLLWRSRRYRLGPGASVEPHQDEPCDVTQRSPLGREYLSLVGSACNGHHFALAPAIPEQRCSFRSGEPAIPCLSLFGEPDADDAAMEALFGMVIDGGPEQFEIPSGAT